MLADTVPWRGGWYILILLFFRMDLFMLEHSKGVLGLWNTFSWSGSIGIPLMEQLRSIGNVRSFIAPVAIIQVAGGNSSKYHHDESVHLSRTQQWLVHP